jgi:hypothetical protein
MATIERTLPNYRGTDQPVVVRAVTVIVGTVVGLTFTFGFGRSRRVRGFLVVCGAGTRW